MSKNYSLQKSRNVLKTCYRDYRKRKVNLPADKAKYIEDLMTQTDEALLSQDRERASELAQRIEAFSKENFRKSKFVVAFELISAVLLALAVAVLVRQVWFELYEIPSGSMRPTFKEKDNLTVSKTTFGINMPLATDHIYFDPDLVQRTSVLIFSGDGIDLQDTDSTYFMLFPYKKRYIKRLIGKPGDSLYFYGGKIYGIDKEGNPIKEFLNAPWLEGLDHVPFLSFEGKVTESGDNQVVFNQMHQPIGRLTVSRTGEMNGEVNNGKEWVKDRLESQEKPHNRIETYSDYYGMRNFAKARLVTKNELKTLKNIDTKGLEEGVLYLELSHTPSVQYPRPVLTQNYTIMLNPLTAIIPLEQRHLDAIMQAMYTARFVVKDGRAHRYTADSASLGSRDPRFPGIPDGTYEFYYGKGSKVHWAGITTELPSDHPLYRKDPANVQRLFNQGVEFHVAYDPSGNELLYPNRYAYFRDGDLYLMGAPILKKEDPTLKAFIEREKTKQEKSTSSKPYVAFKDYGPPLKDGQYDKEFIRTFGITVPEKSYLVLGDNHAMSADSRLFGFVPQANIQGAPCLIIWPPGERWGRPEQKPYPIINAPRLVVWGIAAAIGLIALAISQRNKKKPIFKKAINHTSG